MEYNETLFHKKGFGLSLLKVKVYGTRLKWVRASPGGGVGVLLSGIFSGGVLPVSPKPDLFRPDL